MTSLFRLVSEILLSICKATLAHDPPKCERFGEKIIDSFNKLERDTAQIRIPLLLIALQGWLTSAAIGSERETSARPVLFAQPPTVRTPTSRQR
jgi:hypothetical protein